MTTVQPRAGLVIQHEVAKTTCYNKSALERTLSQIQLLLSTNSVDSIATTSPSKPKRPLP